jgi:formate-dependent nitrite reductase membrane component NrfD
MAAIDRCMATSIHVRYRAFSQKKIASRIVLIMIIFTMILNVHVLIFFELQPSCIPQPGIYAVFYSVYLIIFDGILPDGLILIFALFTFRNVKKLRLRVAANSMVNTARQLSQQRMEIQLVVVSQ